jgi:hypothetical protein
VQRWGRFGLRQRYRCRTCRRTFSSLTGTAAAYTKKLPLWPAYVSCMASSLTIRRSAARVGIAPSTAFRWRHRVLAAVLSADSATHLSGWIELDETGFAYSEKGRRNRNIPPRSRGVGDDLRTRWTSPRVSVPVAYDRSGATMACVVPGDHTRFEPLREQLLHRIDKPATVLITDGPMSRYCATGIRRTLPCYVVPRYGYDRAQPRLHHTDSVRSFLERLVAWLLPFRGVATRYLDHYLAWHRVIDDLKDHVTGCLFMRRLDATGMNAARR